MSGGQDAFHLAATVHEGEGLVVERKFTRGMARDLG